MRIFTASFFLLILCSCTLYKNDGRKFFEANAESTLRDEVSGLEASCVEINGETLNGHLIKADFERDHCIVQAESQQCTIATDTVHCNHSSHEFEHLIEDYFGLE